MRMLEHDVSVSEWVNLFDFMYEKKVLVHHVSSEYDSFNLYRNVLTEFRKKFPQKRIEHIVKLAVPNFSDSGFSEFSFFNKINEYKSMLNSSSELFGIQWMWRNGLDVDDLRCNQFKKYSDLIYASIKRAKSLKLFRNFFVFPYSVQFAKAVLEVDTLRKDFFDGFIVYRNFHEIEYDEILESSIKTNYILRPLNAGKVLAHNSPKQSLNFAISHKNIAGAIVSISSINRYFELI